MWMMVHVITFQMRAAPAMATQNMMMPIMNVKQPYASFSACGDVGFFFGAGQFISNSNTVRFRNAQLSVLASSRCGRSRLSA